MTIFRVKTTEAIKKQRIRLQKKIPEPTTQGRETDILECFIYSFSQQSKGGTCRRQQAAEVRDQALLSHVESAPFCFKR